MLISFLFAILTHKILLQSYESPFWNPKEISRKYPDRSFTLFQNKYEKQNTQISKQQRKKKAHYIEEGHQPPETLNLGAEGSSIFRCVISVQTHTPWGWAGSSCLVSLLSQQTDAWLVAEYKSYPLHSTKTPALCLLCPHCCCLTHRIKQQFCVGWRHFPILVIGVVHDLHGSQCVQGRPAAQPASATPFPINRTRLKQSKPTSYK